MSQRGFRALLVLSAVVLLGVGIYLAVRFSQGPPAPRLAPQEAQALIRTKNVGLGQLENQQIDAGRAAFEQIADKLPADPLGPRNVAVARILALGAEDEEAPAPLVAEAQDALAKMAEIEGPTTEYHWLALAADLAGKDFAAAETHLDALEQADPNDPAARYARYRAGRVADARELSPEARAALANAYNLRPANAWLLVEWLRATGTQLNEELDALPSAEADRTAALAEMRRRHQRLSEQLAAARAAVQAFSHEIQAHARINALDLLEQAAAAIGQSDFQTAASRMLILSNVLLPHSVLDRQAVVRHPLEFVLDRFRPEFYTANQVAEFEAEPPIAVTFDANQAWQPSGLLQEQAGTLRDFVLADFDLDGRLDLFVLGDSRLIVLARKDNDQPWEVVASVDVQEMTGLVVQDLDSDFDETTLATRGAADAAEGNADQAPLKDRCPTADVDVALFGPRGATLVENRFDPQSGQRSLLLVAAEKQPAVRQSVRRLACADLEADGDLDLIAATDADIQLWRNNSDWSFADVSERSVLPAGLGDVTQLVPFDWDRDVDIDVLVASPSGGGWLENLRHGQFRWRPFAEDHPELQAASALAPVDPRGNAAWDLLAAGQDGVRLATRPKEPATVIASAAADRLLTWDYDNDGLEDCLAWSADGLQLLRGLADGKFEVVDLLAAAPQAVAAAEAGDLDGDGDLDLALLSGGQIQLWENQGGNQNHWIDVALQAQQIKGQQLTASGRVSPYGVGSLLELKAGSRYQARVVRGQTTHFGLGRATQADVIRVGWLNGVPQNILQPQADLFICEQQILMGSCPYLYAWNGERFEFVTDLLWNAPIGLQLAEGQLARWRDWEYIRISGRQLKPRAGHYELQVTAELWEADYFDHVKLIAVDHPADIDVYSNEKVGPPQIAEYKIHTVRQPRPLAAARNHAGRDLSPELAQEDGIFAQTYERKWRQGLVEDHYVELDLGDLSQANRVTLFLTGWMYPAATSTNVGLSQGGSLAPATPPSLEVPDGQGGWRTSRPFMGFPGGKTKTIAIELSADEFQVQSSTFKAGSDSTLSVEPGTLNATKLRIRTTMEIYWDHVFFTVDEPPEEVKTVELPLVSADLHVRGFSRVVRDEGNGPERFLYEDVSLQAKWPPMLGRFTRYGEVRELLTQRDDRLLVMGAGDEVTLRFAAGDMPLPEGWTRDFLLYSVGWDKDANLETVLGQSSEPLPFAAMSGYPWPPDQQPPDSPEYREYLRKYQTRRQPAAYWNAIRRLQTRPAAADAD